MTDRKKKLQGLLQQLETERDELKLSIGLAKLEAREEWNELEKKIESVRGRLKVVGEEARDVSEDVAAAAQTLAEEIKVGFARLRERI